MSETVKVKASQVRDYETAYAFIMGGRSKTHRTLGANRFAVLQSTGSIGIIYHYTEIVTYHPDGSMNVDSGGWLTVTTRKWVENYSPVRIDTNGGHWLVRTANPERTPAKVWKCRVCHGKGHGGQYCQSKHVYEDVEGYEGPHEWMRRRFVRTLTAPYPKASPCYRCEGSGRVDYGSNPIYPSWLDGMAVDSTGEPKNPIFLTPKPKVKKQTPMHVPTVDVQSVLAKVLPGLSSYVVHPVTGEKGGIPNIIISLNDMHKWTRERVADWLETLDADLRFTVS